MEASFLKSFIFVLTYLFMIYNLFKYKKNEKILNGNVWICISIMLTMWINTLLASIMSLINIPFRLTTMSICYLIIGIFLRKINKSNSEQKYYWDIWDNVALCIIMAITIVISFKIHDYTLQISYLTSDPAVHFRYALNVMKTGNVKGYMFYAPVNNGLFIDMLSPFLSPSKYYKAFILIDIIMFGIAGYIFYVINRENLKNIYQKIIVLVMAIVYMLGYPLNNKLYGFVYLGMAVSVIAIIVYLLKLYLKNDISGKFSVIVMLLGCNAIVMCYMLFAPAVYFGILIVIIIKYKKDFFSKKVILECFEIFLLPTCLAIYYCYFQFIKGQSLSIASVIGLNGTSYGEVYSNFVFFLPFVIYMIIHSIREKYYKEIIVMFSLFNLFAFIMLFLVFKDMSSWYYFYKIHHVLWLFILWMSSIGIINLIPNHKDILISYLLIILGLLIISFSDINTKIVKKEQEGGYATDYESTSYFSVGFDIYKFNLMQIKNNTKYDKNLLSLYNYAINKLKNYENKIPLYVDSSNFTDVFWYESISGQDMSPYYIWNDINGYTDKFLVKKEVDYMIILYDNALYEKNKTIIESYKKVYKNKKGCIIKIN